VAPVSAELQNAIEQGELTELQLRELIRLEAEAIGLSYAEAVERARARKLPRNYIGADLELLVSLLPA
jgi:hypothetical protein